LSSSVFEPRQSALGLLYCFACLRLLLFRVILGKEVLGEGNRITKHGLLFLTGHGDDKS